MVEWAPISIPSPGRPPSRPRRSRITANSWCAQMSACSSCRSPAFRPVPARHSLVVIPCAAPPSTMMRTPSVPRGTAHTGDEIIGRPYQRPPTRRWPKMSISRPLLPFRSCRPVSTVTVMTLASDVRADTALTGTTGLAEELQALYARAKARVGEDDLAHLRHVTAYGEAIDARRRELLRDGGPRAIRRATALEMMYRLMQFSELGHNIIHGSYDHLPGNGEYHSDRYDWDFNVDVEHWKTMHHVGHHPNTNIVGRDHDLGYSILRGSAGQDWYGHHAGQVAMVSALAALAPLAAPFFLSNIARKVEGHR